MPETTTIQPDVEFIREVMAHGGADLKKCYQCATCSVVCDLSEEGSPFPRRQMLLAQWGMKDQLADDRALWLCHNCGTCTKYCPRGARPGDVMAALRRQAVKSMAVPQFMGKIAATPKLLPLLFLLPVLLFMALAAWAPKGPHTAPFEFANMYAVGVIDAVFMTVSALAVAAFVAQAARFSGALRAARHGSVWKGLVPAVTEIFRNARLTDCEADPSWRAGHLLTLWGFCGLAVTTTLVAIGYNFGMLHTPLPLDHRVKILGNVSAAAAFAGSALLIFARLRNTDKRRASTYFDWFFLGNLAGVIVTGIASEVLRLARTPAMYVMYFIHLVLIFVLFVYAPYSKFAHFLYRALAVASTEPWTPKHPPAPAEIDEEGDIPVYS